MKPTTINYYIITIHYCGYIEMHSSCCFIRDGTNIEVRVEIETQPRGVRQSSLSSILSVESSGRVQSQSQNNLCASEVEESQKREEETKIEAAAEGTFLPVFETETV